MRGDDSQGKGLHKKKVITEDHEKTQGRDMRDGVEVIRGLHWGVVEVYW